MKKSHPEDDFEPLVDKNASEVQSEPQKDEFQKLVDVAEADSIEVEEPQEIEEIQEVEEIEEVEEIQEPDELEKLSQLEDVKEEVETTEEIEGIEEPQEIEEIEEIQQTAAFEDILLTEEHLDIIEEPAEEEKAPKANSLLDTELLEFGQDVPEAFNPPTEPPEPKKSKITQEILLEEFASSDTPEHAKIKGLDELPEPSQNDEPNQVESNQDEAQQELSDEELDFFEIAKESSLKHENKNVVIDDIEYRTESDDSIEEEEEKAQPEQTEEPQEEVKEEPAEKEEEQNEDLDLLKMANESYDNNFDDIINDKTPKSESQIEENDIQEPLGKESLPIYTEEQTPEGASFKTGDKVEHAKYGKGVVVKIVQYEQRQLLQIEFEDSGKKLLDPKVADIKPL